MPAALVVSPEIAIPQAELRFTYVRSSGPGGQNVNKVNTKAVLRWSVETSEAFTDDVRQRFVARYHRRINDTGELIVTSQRYRDQARNQDDCLEKLRELILDVATPPKPRKKTRVPRSVREARLRDKRARAQKKDRRRPPSDD